MSGSKDFSRIHVPLKRPEDVIPHLGSPSHWQPGRSAKLVADAWFSSNPMPASVASVLSTDPIFSRATVLDAFLERCVDIGDGGRPSQTDLMAIVRLETTIGVLAVEAKVDEPFGPTVDEWLAQSTVGGSGRQRRLTLLCALLGLDSDLVGKLRYQLIHRTASAIIEAGRYRVRIPLIVGTHSTRWWAPIPRDRGQSGA